MCLESFIENYNIYFFLYFKIPGLVNSKAKENQTNSNISGNEV